MEAQETKPNNLPMENITESLNQDFDSSNESTKTKETKDLVSHPITDSSIPNEDESGSLKKLSDLCSEVNENEKNNEHHSMDIVEQIADESISCGPQVESVTEGNDVSKLETATDEPEKEELLNGNEVTENCANEIQPYKVSYSFEHVCMIGSSNGVFSADDYLKGCKWSPDGSCLLTNCSDNKLRLFDLPQPLYSTQEWNVENKSFELKSSLCVKDVGTSLYDYDWYPHMSSWNPATCCFASTSYMTPIHLLDAFTGQLRASYNGLDYADEITHAYSVTFGLSGDKIYGGYISSVKIFDVDVPGNKCLSLNLKALNDQKGIVSCIVENPSMPSLFAAATYRKTIGLYTNDGDGVCLLKGQKGGVTHLVFSSDGSKIYSGGRMDNEILCWDLRNPGMVLCVISRESKTNQRMYFNLLPDGHCLATGGTDGIVKFVDITNESSPHDVFHLTAHKDSVNGISFNPAYPILATASGQRHFEEIISDEDEEMVFCGKNTRKIENTVKMWWMGKVSTKDKIP